MFITKN